MNRDSLKTVGAIVLIAAIVGLTFWYGNKQRTDQVKNDKAQQTQTQKSSSQTSTQSTKPAPAPAPVATTPPPAPATTPQTGAETAVIIPLGALVAAIAVKRASDRTLKRALLS